MPTDEQKEIIRKFGLIWDIAHGIALAECPEPPRNGFYSPDKNATKRVVRRWELIVRSGKVKDDLHDRFMVNLKSETYESREMIVSIATALEIPTVRASTKKLIEKMWALAIDPIRAEVTE